MGIEWRNFYKTCPQKGSYRIVVCAPLDSAFLHMFSFLLLFLLSEYFLLLLLIFTKWKYCLTIFLWYFFALCVLKLQRTFFYFISWLAFSKRAKKRNQQSATKIFMKICLCTAYSLNGLTQRINSLVNGNWLHDNSITIT